MGVSINTNFTPYRMRLNKREPIQLSIELINRGPETKRISMQLMMTKQLALDKGGLHSGIEKRIDEFKPNERKRYYFDIFPKTRTRKGEHPLQIKILEHFDDYNYIKRKQVKNLELLVDE